MNEDDLKKLLNYGGLPASIAATAIGKALIAKGLLTKEDVLTHIPAVETAPDELCRAAVKGAYDAVNGWN